MHITIGLVLDMLRKTASHATSHNISSYRLMFHRILDQHIPSSRMCQKFLLRCAWNMRRIGLLTCNSDMDLL